ncbi:MAG: hypothetical protein KGH84_16450, partial [Paracoccaceae bacterium]|nr:hypothetical protein [Paracoccaceae bacterium]
ETRRRIGGDIRLTVGSPMSLSELEKLPRNNIASALRARCVSLGDGDPNEEFRWPSYIRW